MFFGKGIKKLVCVPNDRWVTGVTFVVCVCEGVLFVAAESGREHMVTGREFPGGGGRGTHTRKFQGGFRVDIRKIFLNPFGAGRSWHCRSQGLGVTRG